MVVVVAVVVVLVDYQFHFPIVVVGHILLRVVVPRLVLVALHRLDLCRNTDPPLRPRSRLS